MRRSNTQTLGEVIREYVLEMKMDSKLKEADIASSWKSLMGKTIARYTSNIYMAKRILFVEINSSVVKNELIMLREEIRKRLNESAGEELITKIVFK
jgi:hypothetical protein